MNQIETRKKDIRTRILNVLRNQKNDVQEKVIIELIPKYSDTTISKYLAILEGEKQIFSRRIGRAKLYSLTSDVNGL